MPYPNEHALRLRPPGIFAKESFRRTKGGTLFGGRLKVPATIGLIWAKLKGKSAPSDPPILQAMRFNKSNWTVAAAKAWIKKNLSQKGTFEPASNQSEANSAAITEQGLEDALLIGNLEAYDEGEAISFEEVEKIKAFDYDHEEEIDAMSEVAATLAQLMAQGDIPETEEVLNEEAVADSKEKQETQNIDNVEIFSTGFWNNQKITTKDLDLLISNFETLKDEIKPPNKLGHGSQSLLEGAGLPAAGWVTSLKRIGNKLVASLSDVPNKIARIIKNKGYKRVSVEIYNNYQDQRGKRHGLVLKALSLLGGDIPEVKNLKDIGVLYADDKSLANNSYRRVTLMAEELAKDEEALEEEKEETIEKDKLEEEEEEKKEEEPEEEKETPAKKEVVEEPDEEVETKPDNLAEVMAELAAIKKDQATATGIIAVLQAKNKEQEAAIAMAEHDSFLEGLAAEGKFPPAMKVKAITIMSALKSHEGEVITYSEGDADVETNPLALFKAFLSGLSTVMEMSENAHGADPDKPGQQPKGINDPAYKTDQNYDIEGADVVEKVQKFREANPDASFEEALIQVSREQS